MKLGKVSGTVVSTINHPIFDGRRLLIVDVLDDGAGATGDYLICVDAVGSGHGETVLIIDEGNSARQVIGDPNAPMRAVIVGIVDQLIVDDETLDVA